VNYKKQDQEYTYRYLEVVEGEKSVGKNRTLHSLKIQDLDQGHLLIPPLYHL
jgi:hypothetical protein